MPKVVESARVTTPAGSVWRACACCGRLAALPAGAVDCPACRLLDLAAVLERASNELLYAVATQDGARLVQVLDRLRRDVSPVVADGVLRGLVTSGRLIVAGR